jgi:Ni,Fe-hydrogenase maturation factor
MNQPGSSPVLIVGYGNYDREDDGVAWHILERLANHLGQPLAESPVEF